MPSNDHYVIIGNGPAGNNAATVLRDKDPSAKVTIISDECVPYYYKPKLTGFIAGKVSARELMVNSLEDYEKKGIRIRLGQTVERIEPDADVIYLKHMEKIRYSKLIIASGGRARVLPSMAPYAEHLQFVSSYTDVMEAKEKVAASNRFFVFGGDLVAFKFIRMIKDMGKEADILIYPHAFWPYNLNDDMLKQICGSLSQTAADILVKDDIQQIEKLDHGYRIITNKGIEKKVDMVFSFNGMLPNIDFAIGCGLDTDHGILVNEYLKTNIDNIYACGACAQIYNPAIKSYSASIGWPNATVQGEVAAANLLGEQKMIESVGRKYFDLEGVQIKTTWWGDIEDESLT